MEMRLYSSGRGVMNNSKAAQQMNILLTAVRAWLPFANEDVLVSPSFSLTLQFCFYLVPASPFYMLHDRCYNIVRLHWSISMSCFNTAPCALVKQIRVSE